MDGVVVEVAPCKRFAVKDDRVCDLSARGVGGDSAKLHSFFSLRTLRVVTSVLDRGPIQSADGRNAKCHSDLQYFSDVRTLSSIAEKAGRRRVFRQRPNGR